MKTLLIILACLVASPCFAEVEVVQVSPNVCKQGEYQQPNGYFSIYVFCDDALGTNISVFARDMHNPVLGPSNEYDLGKRFWQGEPWAYDVVSFVWLNKSQLLLSTSGIYGSGSLYLLNLYEKTSKVLFQEEEAVVTIKEIINGSVIIEVDGPDSTVVSKRIAI